MLNPLKKLFDFNAREIARIRAVASHVDALGPEIEALKDEEFPARTQELKQKVQEGLPLESVLPEAFALVREASSRVLSQKHFDTQVIAGIALHEGKIAEQKTGEGKTLTATLPLYLNALTGNGVHLVTVNDYLARRDAGWMGKVFHFLGMSTAAMIAEASFLYDPSYQEGDITDERLAHLRPITRKQAYEADVVYGINSEFGFDYLRDNMTDDPARVVQRGYHFAIVDEADSVLIDEARTPHIISAPVERDISRYYEYARLVNILDPKTDFIIDEKSRTANLTDAGVNRIEQSLGVSNIYEKDFETLFHIEAALKAQTLFRKDKDYIVANDEVVIVDEFTGRLLQGRRFSEGLHQAIEAKERVSIKQESKTLATVSLQNYFRMYKKLAGMTGTAATEAEEFHKIYKTDVLVIPTHRPMRRKDMSDMIYKTEKGKYNAVAEEIATQHKAGRPVLVGTTSIEKNEFLSALLKRKGVPHALLNAKNHEQEASIIARAGERGAVTVATNMAGRGVDIILGGADGKDHDEVVELGGLCVIGTERHESRRIDNQLRGRSGRQGDPGSSQFFVALEDDLMRIFGGEQISKLMTFFNFPEDQPLSAGMVTRAIESAQQKVEGHNFDIRKHLVEYDDVLNKQREIVYGLRRQILQAFEGDGSAMESLIDEKIRALIAEFAVQTGAVDKNEQEGEIMENLHKDVGVSFRLSADEVKQAFASGSEEQIAEALYDLVRSHIDTKKREAGEEMWVRVVRYICLSAVDNLWTEHLTAIEDLREGINLRGYGQLDPLVEYKNEAFKLFESLMRLLDSEIVRGIMYVQIKQSESSSENPTPKKSQPLVLRAAGGVDPYTIKGIQKDPDASAHMVPGPKIRTPEDVAQQSSQAQSASGAKIGRNDPCPCGAINDKTGRPYKFKQCGLINAPWHKG